MTTPAQIAHAIYGAGTDVLGRYCCKSPNLGMGTLEGGYRCARCGATTILRKVVQVKVKRPKKV